MALNPSSHSQNSLVARGAWPLRIEKELTFDTTFLLGDDEQFVRSMLNLQEMIEAKLLTHEQIIALYQNMYAPKLLLSAYTYGQDNNDFTIYSHTPNGVGINNEQKQKSLIKWHLGCYT